MIVKGYKAFNSDLTCKGFQYEIGHSYEFDGEIELCSNGFHFCTNIADCFRYYDSENARFAEVEAYGDVIESKADSKCVTNRLRIKGEIPRDEALKMSNTGDRNTGNRNTGNCNTGDRNTGNWNTGNWNTGNWNTGNWNTGDRNTGDRNTGNRNTGNRNTGDRNTGDRNTGDRNTGNWNTGNRNTGDWNLSDCETGCFCTEEFGLRFFNKQSYISYGTWINSKAREILSDMPGIVITWILADDMTDEEKQAHQTYKTTGGYLKITDKEEARQDWWYGLSQEDKDEVMSLPNFDPIVFKECTGIDVLR